MVKKIINSITQNRMAGLCALLLCTALVYSNTFLNEFIVDDYLFIADWPLIENLSHWPQFFGPDNQPVGEEGVYSPLKTCFHALNFQLWGTNPIGYHFVALLIHLLGTAFVYKISHQLTSNNAIALLSGLLFGLHPIHVEAITFLTASIDTLGIVFLFISFYYYICSKEKPAANIYALVFAVLAVFTHELAIILPFLFYLYDVCLNQKIESRSQRFNQLAPYFVISFSYVVLKFLVLESVNRGGYLLGSIYLTMLVIIKALAKYVLIILFPFQLSLNPEISEGIYSVDWQYFDRDAVLLQSFFDVQVLLSVLLTGALIYIAVIVRKKWPLASFCIGWFYVSLLPVLNIIPSESYFAERYLYTGSMAFCLGAAVMLHALYSGKFIKGYGKQAGVVLIVVILTFYSARTITRNSDWRNELSFLEAETKVNPNHPMMIRDLGTVYLQHGMPQKALGYLQKAVFLRPFDEAANFALAEGYTELGDYTNAVAYYLKATELNDEFAEAYYNLGEAYAALGESDLAREALEKASRLFYDQEKFHQLGVASEVYRAHFGSDQ